MTLKQVAELLNVNQWTIYRLVKEGKIRRLKLKSSGGLSGML
jgi:excisionase family DNA binding protein